LERTENAAAGVLRELGAPRDPDWLESVPRWVQPVPAFSPRGRFRRAGELVASLGLQEVLSQRVRLEGRSRGVGLACRVLPPDPPRPIRILQGNVECAAASEVDGFDAVGRALSQA